jgi:hypothetical protein
MALLLEGTWSLGGTPETIPQKELEDMDPLIEVGSVALLQTVCCLVMMCMCCFFQGFVCIAEEDL